MATEKNLTVSEFCDAERISKVHYYNLKRRGEGPDEVRIGRRAVITPEAKREWEARMTKRGIEADATA